VQCFYHLDVPGSGQSAAHCINYFYYPHATAFYGETAERDQAMADGYFLANRLGMDTFELWPMIKLLKDLYREGRITDTSELPLSAIGSREFIKCLMECIANRTGIGDILAEGGARASDRIRDGWQWARQYYPAYGSAIHGAGRYSVGNSAGFALLWALDSRCPSIDQHSYLKISESYQMDPPPPSIDQHSYLKISESYQMDPPPNRLSKSHAEAIAKTLYGSEGAIDHATFDQKAEAVVYTQNRSAVINILVVCDWVYPVLISQVREDRRGDTSLESRLLAAVTGRERSEEELTLVGERVWNLARAHMVREGRNRDQDTINDVFFGDPKDGALSRSNFETAKTRYYHLRGWDERTGTPTPKTLSRLGLDDVAETIGNY
jgi:aldehyde:ferredoxin oxidoreductase